LKSILLIDNYIDESVLQLFIKRSKNVTASIYTRNFTKILKQDLKKYNSQYPPIIIKEFSIAHDRFLIIDETIIYHFGASLKDLGKKCRSNLFKTIIFCLSYWDIMKKIFYNWV
jgi:hypothetical protein